MEEIAIAVDLGGTNLRCSVIDAGGQIRFDARQSSDAAEGVDAVIERIARMIETAAVDQNLKDNAPVGVAAPGPLDPRRGIVRYAPNLPGWNEVPLRDRLEALTGRPVTLGNDANAQALGEFHFGAARTVQNLVYVALGTGFGGGVISGGALIDGASGLGAELGHTTVNFAGPRCSCGSLGCVEAYCSGWAIARDGQMLADSDRSPLLARAARGRTIDARAVADAAEAGDESAQAVLRRAGFALGAALGNFINIFNPEMVVIGGGLAAIGEALLHPARKVLPQFALKDLADGVEIRGSELGSQTGLFGAAAMVLKA